MADGDDGRTPGLEAHAFADDGIVPNSPLPLLIRRGAVDGPERAADFEARFAGNGWTGAWRNGIYPYDHYHTTAHEVLGVASGSATVRFGGPRGHELALSAGDAVVIPAGVGHALVSGSPDFLVVGAYAEGREWDVVRADPAAVPAARRRIAALPRPRADPLDGRGGPLLRLWG